MVEETENHGLNKFSKGDTNWSHSPDMQHIEERLVIRDREENITDYTPYSTATFVATDTGVVYDGDGSTWGRATREYDGIQSDTLNQRKIRDSTGKYLGTLDGNKDAQKVNDAIQDRRQGAAIILPAPEFDLDWDQEVIIPPNERGFTLATAGTPMLDVSEGVSGSAIKKPSTTASQQSTKDYQIGSLIIDDTGSESLDWGMDLDDLKSAWLDRIRVRHAPGIRIQSSNNYSNQNYVSSPQIQTKEGRGPGILLDDNNSTTDQNLVLFPFFSDGSPSTEIAYIDRGKHNSWAHTRVEWARVCHEMDGRSDGRNYYVSEGGWDRSGDIEYTLQEKNGAHGVIDNVYSGLNHDKLELNGPPSKVRHLSSSTAAGIASASSVDLMADVNRITTAKSLASIGIRDNSEGGGVSVGLASTTRGSIDLTTRATKGSAAIADIGDGSLKECSYPKSTTGIGAMPEQGILLRIGLYRDEGNRAEIIYDPENKYGEGMGEDWYLQVRSGGVTHGTRSLGNSPAEGRLVSLNANKKPNGNIAWSGTIGTGTNTEVENSGSRIKRSTWRWYLESRDGNKHTARILPDKGVSLYCR